MIIVTEQDYDYTETVGIFPTLERALEHFKKHDLKPQHYIFQEILGETEFKNLNNIPIWCSEERCQIDKELQNFSHWNKMYCSSHYDNAVRRRKEGQRIYALKEIEHQKQMELDRLKRTEFEEKWDIKGYWWSDFVYEQSTEEETKKKVDYWKDSNNWMSGSSISMILPQPEEELEEGSAPKKVKFPTVMTKNIPKDNKDNNDTFIMTQRGHDQ